MFARITKSFENILTTKDFSVFWRGIKNVFSGREIWKKIESIKKDGAEKTVRNFFEKLKNIEDSGLSDGFDPDDHDPLKLLGSRVCSFLDEKNYQSLAVEIFLMNIQHISESKSIKLPDDLSKLNIPKDFLPALNGEMFMSFTVLGAFVLSPIYEEINKLKGEDLDNYFALVMVLFFELISLNKIEEDLNTKNPNREKQINEFIDKERKIMSNYYSALENNLRRGQMKNQMRKFIEKDSDFFDTYLALADFLYEDEEYFEADELLRTAFTRALKRIVDKDGNWPKVMPWGFLENRHLIRAIDRWAYKLWEDDHNEYALEIFRKLLKSNPNDNVGVRYEILAILLGHGPEWQEEEF
ncbi:MAG: hypothetical protein HW401_235, partial [Parcubacteria group bacterium]|nr:hypothetical protein [Parcubacteria group bacterium]